MDRIKGLRAGAGIKAAGISAQLKVQVADIAAAAVAHLCQGLSSADGIPDHDGGGVWLEVGIAGVGLAAVVHHDVVPPASSALADGLIGGEGGALLASEPDVDHGSIGRGTHRNGGDPAVAVDVVESLV